MLMMASAGFALYGVSKLRPYDPLIAALGPECDHAEWVGCTLWDLIQPSFMFMVGVALPWSLASRRARGESTWTMTFHALWRAVALVLLATFLQSNGKPRTDWTFPNVLAQIGLAYPFLFLISFARPLVQWLAAIAILVAYWLAFVLYTPPEMNWKELGLKENWEHLSGFAAHWDKHLNLAGAFDRWFLNLFRRGPNNVFKANEGGYQTLNFIPSLGTMIFGVLAGQFLRGDLPVKEKALHLAFFGCIAIAFGYALDYFGVCPMVKRIWTPTFAIYSAGWAALMLSGFMAAVEVHGWKRWAFPFIVAGLNPITLYCMWQMVVGGLVRENFKTHFGQDIFKVFGPDFEQSLFRAAHVTVMWLILLWMYRRKIVIRI